MANYEIISINRADNTKPIRFHWLKLAECLFKDALHTNKQREEEEEQHTVVRLMMSKCFPWVGAVQCGEPKMSSPV